MERRESVFGLYSTDSVIHCAMQNLEDPEENPMVRHECAEALGSIAKVKRSYEFSFLEILAYAVKAECIRFGCIVPFHAWRIFVQEPKTNFCIVRNNN